MAWEQRGNNRYLYRKVWLNGKVKSEYIGAGYHAELIAQSDEQTALQRDLVRNAEREECRRQTAIDNEIKQHGGKLRQLVESVLVAAGFHQHKRQWRKKRMLRVSSPSELASLVSKTYGKKPKREDIEALQAALVQYPEAAARLGNLSLHVQVTILRRMFGELNHGLELAVAEHCSQLKLQLGYDSSNPIERAMIDHVVVCWLRQAETEMRYESLMNESSVTLTRQEHWEKRLAMTQQRYLRAVESLAKVRRLLSSAPLAQINIASQVANIGSIHKSIE